MNTSIQLTGWACLGLLALVASAAQAEVLAQYNFDTQSGRSSSADETGADIRASDITWSTGNVPENDGRDNPYGPPHWKKYGTGATLQFTLEGVDKALAIEELSFALQMDTKRDSWLRILEITSSATGDTVLHTVYNYHAAQATGTPRKVDWIDKDWDTRTLDLGKVKELQNVAGPVTFTFTFRDANPGAGGEKCNLRLDAVVVSGR